MSNFAIKSLLLMAILCPGLFIAHAGEISTIELSDGSVISGEVVSFDGNVWTIQSGSMGTLKIDGSKVVSIRSKTTPSQTQQSIMANEQIMTMIMNLQTDPEIQAILKDPEIMKAVNAGDVNALLFNPKFIKFMENTKIRDITKEVK
ncbi:MAG: hypothetical protein JRH03_09275 [Deltaproteobacteria bacterium]|nr:hypothetical protein [Deltaproteobacteria bacterium]